MTTPPDRGANAIVDRLLGRAPASSRSVGRLTGPDAHPHILRRLWLVDRLLGGELAADDRRALTRHRAELVGAARTIAPDPRRWWAA